MEKVPYKCLVVVSNQLDRLLHCTASVLLCFIFFSLGSSGVIQLELLSEVVPPGDSLPH